VTALSCVVVVVGIGVDIGATLGAPNEKLKLSLHLRQQHAINSADRTYG
jgi:hypothetical protein